MRSYLRHYTTAVFLLISFQSMLFSQKVGLGLWSDIRENEIRNSQNRQIIPDRYRTIKLDLIAMQKSLSRSPMEFEEGSLDKAILIDLPMPDGNVEQFLMVESPVMEAGLASQFPEIKTYAGQGVDHPEATVRLDITPKGFHAMVYSPYGTYFIDPYADGNTGDYISYYKRDFTSRTKSFSCYFDEINQLPVDEIQHDKGQPIPDPDQKPERIGSRAFGDCHFRTYRLALACSGEYAAFHGGTVALALAAEVTTMNRVNGVFEMDFNVRMIIIANNNLIIYTNAATDPYSNGNPSSMISQNQTNTDAVIGSANYDIGHVFGTNSGGLAGLGVVCLASNKARGVTGSGAPVGDAFDIDYVAHEIGHQFGGNHTQNNACNRNGPTAWEPGSGLTIMGYAGICPPDIQPNSDAFFHGGSIGEMYGFILAGGNTCAVQPAYTNNAPTITSWTGNETIPKGTPFQLSASATDADGNALTYCWEQRDNQVSTQPPVGTSTGGPNFRSFYPTISGTRYFPRLTDLVNNVSPVWEVLPTVGRVMNFRVVVRDNKPGGGCNDHKDMVLTIDGTSGPFSVTYPSAAAISWAGNSMQTVTWNVLNTDIAPVSCANVDILLSTDGGFTYPTTLATAVPNDGSEAIVVPNISTTTARIMVRGSGRSFFDISNNNFAIVGVCDITNVTLINIGSCNSNGTNDPSDDYYTADVVINFVNPPPTGNLQIEPGGDAIGTYSVPVAGLMGNSHTFTNVQFKADGMQTIVETEFTIPANQCVQTTVGPTVGPCSPVCDITSVAFTNIQPCNNIETMDPTDDYYSADVVINFVNPPQTGNLQIEPGGDAIGTYSVPVAGLMGNSHTFTNVQFKADGMPTIVEAEFTIPANLCVQTQVGPTVQPCSSTPPVLTCPSSTTVSCASNVPAANPASVGETHDCPGAVTITHVGDVISNQTCANRYTITRTYLATDLCGNTASCSQVITVLDNTPPTLTCPSNLTVSCASQVPVAVTTSVTGVSDACGGTVAITFLPDVITNQTCANRYTITRTYLATDLCGNTASCSQTITVLDNTPPTLTCPANLTVSCASQVPAANTSLVTGVSDACGGAVTVSVLPDVISNQTCANRYIITRTYRATDICGNTGSCSQTITVFDNTPPTLICFANLTVSCASQVPIANTGLVTGVSDACGGTVTVSVLPDAISNQTCANRYTITRTYVATDVCGNTGTCAQTITVFDNIPPSIACPANLTVQCANLVPVVNVNTIMASDNCTGTVTVTHVGDVITNQTCLNRFTLTRTYRATDVCGNSATCTQVITVFDNTPPVITFTDPLLAGLPSGGTLQVQCFGQDPEWDLPAFSTSSVSAMDNCTDNVTVSFNETLQDEGNCLVDGYINQYRLTWVATDACGNSTTSFVWLELIDTIPPVILGVPEDIVVNCDEVPDPPVDVTAADECRCACVILYHQTGPAPGCQDGQVITRSWTARDDCGNETVETQYIRLIDHKGPELTITQPEIAGTADGTIINYTCNQGGIPQFYDQLNEGSVWSPVSCGGSPEISFHSDADVVRNCEFFGYIEQRLYTWIGVDQCGNETSLTIIVRLIDNEPPVLIGVPEMVCADDPALTKVEAVDNCGNGNVRFWDVQIPSPCGNGKALRRTYEAFDPCGNTTRDTTIIITDDNEPPVMTFTDPDLAGLGSGEFLTVQCSRMDGLYTTFGTDDVSVVDDCPAGVAISFKENLVQSADCSSDGILAKLQLQWTATDMCGNSSQLSAMVHIVDHTPPVFLDFDTELTISCTDSLPEIQVIDNCGEVHLETAINTQQSDCPYEYELLRVYTATDPCGNVTVLNQTIHVGDKSGPVISGVVEEICDDLSLPKVTAYDRCADQYVQVTMTETEVHGTCREGRVIERIWSAKDACGNIATKHQRIILGDQTPPEILVATNSVIQKFIDTGLRLVNLSQSGMMRELNDLNEYSIYIEDECDEAIIPVFTLDVSYADNCATDGYYERRVYTWVATDICGNSSVLSITVDIMDDVPPVISAIPEEATIICAPLPAAGTVNTADYANPVNVAYTQSTDPGAGPGEYSVTRTWIATDVCGNTSSATQHITWIPDTQLACDIYLPESVDCNSHDVPITSGASGGLGGITYAWEVFGEKCFIQSGQGTPAMGMYIGWNPVEITLTLTDAYGCSTTCQATLDCEDIAPSPLVENAGDQDAGIHNVVVPAIPSSPESRIEEANLSQFNLWPNPAKDAITISFESLLDQHVQVSLINFVGQTLLRDDLKVAKGTTTHQLDVSKVPEGGYMIQLRTDSDRYTKVLMIMRKG
ncbi:MAG: T9SS type A sorting domain-containing protein [Saprospiraceae bacterium]|nr:T9SS type A sorting domain-containing protein [Candidatus Opimibacter iunctus]